MKQFLRQNLVVIMLVASFFATAVLQVLIMNETMAASQTCLTGITQTKDCHQPEGITCCTTEVTTLQNFLQVIPQQFTKILIASLAAVSFLSLLLLVLLYENSLFAVFQSWQKMLRQRILAFHRQIGFWLTLIEKRDPAHNSLWRWFEFAMIPIT